MKNTVVARNNIYTTGSGTQTLVFAHGFGSDQSAWRHQVEALAPFYRIVLFDHVGSGKSDFSAYSPRRYHSLFGYVEDLLEICEALKLRDVVFVGHSVSGMIGLLASLIDARRFAQMVLLGASPRYLNDGAYCGGFDQSDLNTIYESMETNYYAWIRGFAPLAMQNPDQPELAQEFARTLANMRPDIAMMTARTIFQSDHRADLPRITLQTLILQSTNDVAVPPYVGQYLSTHIPNNDYLILPATGHFPHLSAPQSVTKAIKTALSLSVK